MQTLVQSLVKSQIAAKDEAAIAYLDIRPLHERQGATASAPINNQGGTPMPLSPLSVLLFVCQAVGQSSLLTPAL
jgi:hypothetical protein